MVEYRASRRKPRDPYAARPYGRVGRTRCSEPSPKYGEAESEPRYKTVKVETPDYSAREQVESLQAEVRVLHDELAEEKNRLARRDGIDSEPSKIDENMEELKKDYEHGWVDEEKLEQTLEMMEEESETLETELTENKDIETAENGSGEIGQPEAEPLEQAPEDTELEEQLENIEVTLQEQRDDDPTVVTDSEIVKKRKLREMGHVCPYSDDEYEEY